MLALKVNLAQKSSVETLVFDEVDSGIGGATAQAVGERLSRLAQKVQVLAVTHSPQVAAFSNEHFKVSKATENNVTLTQVEKLSDSEKKEEMRFITESMFIDTVRSSIANAISSIPFLRLLSIIFLQIQAYINMFK